MQVTPESILHDGHLDRYDFSYTMGGYDTVNIQAYIALQ